MHTPEIPQWIHDSLVGITSAHRKKLYESVKALREGQPLKSDVDLGKPCPTN
jgi:hypothetical protein